MRFCVAPLLGHRSIEPQSRLKRSIQSAATVGSATQCGYERPVEAGRSFRVSIEKKTAGPAKQSRRYRYGVDSPAITDPGVPALPSSRSLRTAADHPEWHGSHRAPSARSRSATYGCSADRAHARASTPELIRATFDPLHSGLALVVIEAAFPLLPHLALAVIADHGERAQRGCVVPDSLLADRRTRIHESAPSRPRKPQAPTPSACASTSRRSCRRRSCESSWASSRSAQ